MLEVGATGVRCGLERGIIFVRAPCPFVQSWLTAVFLPQNVRYRCQGPDYRAVDVEDGVPPPRAAPALLRRVVLSPPPPLVKTAPARHSYRRALGF